jgi:putative membrane protein
MVVLGWSLIPIALFHIIPLSFSALSWRALSAPGSRLNLFTTIWIRWVRESINALLPVAGVGGDIVNARLAHLSGVPGAQAAASLVVDTTMGVATQLIFVIAGATLLAADSTKHSIASIAWTLLVGIGLFAAATAAFVRLQHRSLFATLARLAHRLAPANFLSDFAGSASAIDEAVVATYRRGPALLGSGALRLIGWAAGAGEIWLAMHFLARPFSLADCFILESLSSAVRAAAFMVPGALGAQEGGFVLFGALFGLPPDIALAVSLSKRVRELALGLPGLVVWQAIEAGRLLRQGSAKTPSSAR